VRDHFAASAEQAQEVGRELSGDEGLLPLPGEGAREALPRVCCARRSSRASGRAPSLVMARV